MESREKSLNMYQNVSKLHSNIFLWIPSTIKRKIVFVGRLIFLWVLKPAKIASCFAFRKNEFRLKLADSPKSKQVSHILCGFRSFG